MAKSTPLSYNEAIEKIENILREIDSQQLDVDALGGKVAEARKLIALCRSKLEKASIGS